MPSLQPSAAARTAVFALSLLAGSLGLYWIAKAFVIDGHVRFGNPVDTAAAEAPHPLVIRAEITRVSQGELVRPGQTCDLLVQHAPRKDGRSECNAQVTCGARLLYGGPQRGYFPCQVTDGLRTDVIGLDASTSRTDQDPAFKLDTRLGVLSIWDDETGPLGAYKVDADVLSLR
jgi:hypothetical protein